MLYQVALQRRLDDLRRYPIAPVFAEPEREAPPEDTATQTELDVVFASAASLPLQQPQQDTSASLPKKLPSVDELTCDAETAGCGLDLDDLTRDPTTGLLVDPSSSFAPPELDQTARAMAPLSGRPAADEHDVVWSQRMAEQEFGVVPVVEMGDFVL